MGLTAKKAAKYELNGTKLAAIRNSNELLVIEAINKLRSEYPDFCGCDLCMQDVYALALNALPPRYVQPVGINLKKRSSKEQWTREAEDGVAVAIRKISEHPSH